MNDNQKKAFDSIVKTWQGGERKLAGARASELIYGAGKTPNKEMQTRFLEELPGIGDYISAPNSGVVVDTVQDKGYEPETAPSNLSSDEGKDEQNAVDDVLKPGREKREEKRGTDTVGSTELNPPENQPFGGKGDHDGDGKIGGSKYRK